MLRKLSRNKRFYSAESKDMSQKKLTEAIGILRKERSTYIL